MVKFQRPDKSFNNFLQIMDGFGAGAGQFKAWEYKNGEIMVLELADNVKKDMESRIKNIAKPLKILIHSICLFFSINIAPLIYW